MKRCVLLMHQPPTSAYLDNATVYSLEDKEDEEEEHPAKQDPGGLSCLAPNYKRCMSDFHIYW